MKNLLLAVFALMLTLPLRSEEPVDLSPPQAWVKTPSDGGAYTVLMTAYAPEIQALLSEVEKHPLGSIETSFRVKGITYWEGTFGDTPVLLMATGMSIANAAMSTQMVLDYFPVERILYAGISGGVNPEWKVGDVVVPERWYYHDESAYFNPAAEEGWLEARYYQNNREKQEAKKDPHWHLYQNFGMIFPDEVLVIREGMEKPEPMAYFTVTPHLLETAREALADFSLPKVSEDRQAKVSVGGNAVTGSVFVDNRDYRLWLRDTFKAELTEMESAAVGQVCFINGVDWLIIRSLSDLAGGQEGENEEHIFADVASQTAVMVMLRILEALGDVG